MGMGDNSQKADDPKAELLSRVSELLERLLKEKKESSSRCQRFFAPIKAFFQSTFFITVVGGVLLALLPLQWQNRAAVHREREAEATQIAERKERLAYQFAKDFPLSVHLAGCFRKRQLWMGDREAQELNKPYADGRTFAETRDYTEKLVDQYLLLGPTASICNQIAASFPNSTNITSRARALSENVTALINATNDADVESAYNLASANYQILTEVIFTELNKTNENTTHPR
jgi:hypothetical protein